MSELLIKNGMVYTYIYEGFYAIKIRMADVLIKDGLIAEIGPDIKNGNAELDAAGCLVLPGLVNMGSNTFAARITSGLLCDWRAGRSKITPMLDLAAETLSEEEVNAISMLGLWETLSSGVTTVAEIFGPSGYALRQGVKRAAAVLGVRLMEAPQDRSLLVESAVSCAHFGIPYAGMPLIEAEKKLTIGTGCFDSCMISEMRAVACSVKQLAGDARAYKASDVFYSATVAGGLVFDEKKYGRLDRGFFGDLSVVCMDRFAPLSYPLSQYVYGANAGDVRHVVCGGEVLKRDYKPAEHLKAPLKQAKEIAETAILRLWAEARRRIL